MGQPNPMIAVMMEKRMVTVVLYQIRGSFISTIGVGFRARNISTN